MIKITIINKMNDIEVATVLQTKNVEENTDSYKKTSSKLNVVSFTYDDKTIIVTHDMTLHISIPGGINFQTSLYDENNTYLLDLAHIILTKLISIVPDTLTFNLYIFKIPSCNISYEFARDAFEILKPLIFANKKTMCTYERYFVSRDIEEYTD